MPSVENQPTETDLNQETGDHLETDQQTINAEAQDRLDSVADGYDKKFDSVEAQESQPQPPEHISDAQERSDSVADGADNDHEGQETTFSNAHENVSRTEFANAPDVKKDFNEVAPDKKPEDGDNGDNRGDDDEPRPTPPDLNYA